MQVSQRVLLVGLAPLLAAALFLARAPLCEQAASVREGASPAAIFGEASFLSGYPARNEDGTINVVVEIPAGTNDKWEVIKDDGSLRWETRNGRPRVVDYLGYPGNYGMVPSTLLAEEQSGDGDPLDVILLGPALPRGTVVRARLLGVLEMLDGGETDDKLIAVSVDSPFADVADLDQLDDRYPGVSAILELWFANYKGPGEIEVTGFSDRAAAEATLDRAATSFARDTPATP